MTAGETTANTQVAGMVSMTAGTGSSTTAGQGGHVVFDAGVGNGGQRRNLGKLSNNELEKKYDHFYLIGQSIALRVGTLDLTKQQTEQQSSTRRPSIIQLVGGILFHATMIVVTFLLVHSTTHTS